MHIAINTVTTDIYILYADVHVPDPSVLLCITLKHWDDLTMNLYFTRIKNSCDKLMGEVGIGQGQVEHQHFVRSISMRVSIPSLVGYK